MSEAESSRAKSMKVDQAEEEENQAFRKSEKDRL